MKAIDRNSIGLIILASMLIIVSGSLAWMILQNWSDVSNVAELSASENQVNESSLVKQYNGRFFENYEFRSYTNWNMPNYEIPVGNKDPFRGKMTNLKTTTTSEIFNSQPLR
ncbi:MAG: hypothetical protein WCK11_05645 [Candidatus Falkowbacteria bacterium]